MRPLNDRTVEQLLRMVDRGAPPGSGREVPGQRADGRKVAPLLGFSWQAPADPRLDRGRELWRTDLTMGQDG